MYILMDSSASKTFAPTAQWDDTVLPYFTAAFGSAGLDAVSAALCRPPLSNSFRVNTDKIPLAVSCSFDQLGRVFEA